MPTFEEIEQHITVKIEGLQKFKIGKTDQIVDENFIAKHESGFTFFDTIVECPFKSTVETLEEYLLKFFLTHPKCANKKWSPTELSNANYYYVYIVWN